MEAITRFLEAFGNRIDSTLDLFSRDMRDVAAEMRQSVGDFKELSRPQFYSEVRNGSADGAGDGELTFPGPAVGSYWLVDRISVGSAGAAAEASIYLGSVAPGNLVDYTDAAERNVSDLGSPIYVPPGNELLIVFAGVTASAPISARVQARIIPEWR